MIYIDAQGSDPYFNLALEECVFDTFDKSKQYLILWQNDNTIVLGKYQNAYEEINFDYIRNHDVKVARRLSGGGAVYHDLGNLNFTFIVDAKDIDDFNFKAFITPVINALQEIGIEAKFNGRNDITISGLKFSGNSQYIKNDRIMHHGCIMVDSNLETVTKALNTRMIKCESKGIKSVRSRITSINSNLDIPISVEAFKKLLINNISESTSLDTYTLTCDDINKINCLAKNKYATFEWNYGKSPMCSLRKERKFDAGIVTCYLEIENASIKDIHLYGDFFGNEDIRILEKELIGCKLEDSLLNKIQTIPIKDFMTGISSNELYNLIIS